MGGSRSRHNFAFCHRHLPPLLAQADGTFGARRRAKSPDGIQDGDDIP